MRGGVLGLALAGWAGILGAQATRPFSTYRQHHGESRLDARLEFAGGSLKLSAGQPTELYRMSLSYDPERFAPLSRYDAAAGAVVLGVETAGGAGLHISEKRLRQRAAVELSPRADLTVDLALGAVDADLDLGGLRLAALRLKTGASRTVVRFSSPNPVPCRSATISAGAAEVSVYGLGNSRCAEVRMEGGIGRMTLDFGGTGTADQRADLSLAVGELVLRLPRDVGVRIALDRFFTSVQPAGLVRRGSEYVTPGYDSAPRHLDIALRTAVGSVRVERAD